MVKHVAFLVRLGIREEEAQAFSHQFTSIIDYFHLLNEVDTEDVPPACETSNTRSVMRADEVQPSMPRENFLMNAPHRGGDYVQVPQVFDEE
jgi:aspartyl-tRNA(Asn)/glutamyl-tRNA(Gln) amidotransferase subunit C